MKLQIPQRFVLAVLVFVRFTTAFGFGFGLRGETAQGSQVRADVFKSRRSPSQDSSNEIDGDAEVINQEMIDLRKKLRVAEADKKELVQALRQMLAKNSTQLFKKQAEKAQQQKLALELKCGRERQALEAQLKESQKAAQKSIEEAKDKCGDAKELAQTLQEQNVDLQKRVRALQSELSKSNKLNKELSSDKASLVSTMHSLMRETSRFKQALKKEEDTEGRQAKELAADEAKIAKLKPKPKPAQKKHVKVVARKAAKKASPHKREESMAAQMAHLKAINHYIIRSQEVAAEDVDVDLDAKEDAAPAASTETNAWKSMGQEGGSLDAEPGHQLVHTSLTSDQASQAAGLREWLGLKVPQPKPSAGAIPKDANGMSPIDALDPEAVKQEKKAEAQKKKEAADDGGDGIESLLKQAKEQLQAMDDVDSSS